MKTVNLTWDLPITRGDGTPLPTTEIKHVQISLSADLGASYVVLNPTPAGPITQLTVPDLEVGEWRFRAVVIDTQDRPSANADLTVVIASDAAPNPVSNFTFTLT
jgi:hypothetical protein